MFFAVSQRPRLKKRYHRRTENVKEYLKTVKDYDELVFTQSLSTIPSHKLAEAQEKKAKGGLVSGLLSKKRSKVGDVSKDDPVVTPPFAHSPAKRPTSPTSSLEVIASTGEKTKKKKKKKKVGGKPFLPSFGKMLMLLLLRLIRRFLWTA